MGNSNTVLVQDYTPDGQSVLRMGYDPFQAVSLRMCKEVMRVLLDHYPGYAWAVTTDYAQGYIGISLPALMGPTFKYVIFIDHISDANSMDRELKKAGGEILERFQLSRRGLFLPEYCDVRAKNPDGRFVKAIPE